MNMITSTSNENIKRVSLLVKNAKARRKEGLFVIEGERIVSEIPEGTLRECYVTQDFMTDDRLSKIFSYKVDPTVVSDQVFAKMSDTQSPQGILCVCEAKKEQADDFLEGRKRGPLKLLVLERIQDPGNLGTMIRTAEGAGFDALIADENTVDVYNPKVARSTMGSLFRVPLFYVSDLVGTITQLKNNGITVYAAHLKGETDYTDEAYEDRMAVLIGNEGSGLSDEITDKADRLVRIPMKGKLESLNAAVAAALLMYNTLKAQN